MTKEKAKELLYMVQNFILKEIVPDDVAAKREITEIFNQLISLINSH